MLTPEPAIPQWLLSAIAPLLDQSPDGIHIIDHAGNLIYANHTFLRMIGRDRTDRAPEHVSEWDAQWAADELPALVAAKIERGAPFHTRHRRRDGSCYDAAISVSTITHEGQSYLFCTVRDVSEQRQTEAALRESEEQYRLLVADLKEVVFRTDTEGRWLFLNSAWQEVTGFAVDASLGQIFLEYVHPDDRQRNLDLFHPLLERKKDYCRHEIRYLHRDGGFRWVEVWARLTLDAQRNVTGTAGTLTDITERRQDREALRESEARFRTIFFEDRSVKLLIDPRSGQIADANQAAIDFYGYSYKQLTHMHIQAINQLSPQEVAQEMRSAAERRKNYFNFRHRLASGVVRDVEVYSNTLEIKHQTYLLSFIHDVTEGRRAEAALRESALELQAEHDFALAVMNTMGQGLTVTDASGRFEYINPAYAALIGYHPEDLIGKRPEDLTSAEAQRELESALATRQAGKASTYESRLVHADGTMIDVQITGTPRWRDGRIVGSITVITDLNERKQIEAELRLANVQLRIQMEALRDLQTQLREQAIRDPLTNLYNRRYLDETLPREVARVRRLNHQIAVLMIDIDHFKRINDTYGHGAGDETLRSVAALIRARLRSSDIACRYGGEEILCVLIDTNLENAFSRAEGLRLAVASTPIIQAHPDVRVTISIGVAIWPESGRDIAAVMQAADMALYHAKLSGRNRVRITQVERGV